MLKKIICAGALVASTLAHGQCTVSYKANGPMAELMGLHSARILDIPNYNALCTKLEKADAQLVMVSSASVLAGVPVAWITLYVGDKHSPFMSSFFLSNTRVSQVAPSTDIAQQELIHAFQLTATHLPIDQAIAELQQFRKDFLAQR